MPFTVVVIDYHTRPLTLSSHSFLIMVKIIGTAIRLVLWGTRPHTSQEVESRKNAMATQFFQFPIVPHECQSFARLNALG